MTEERIYIIEVKEGDPCPFEEYCEGFSKLCKGCNVLPTRQQAIERIVKAFVNLYIEIEGTGITYTAKEAAEAALNALLEVEK